MEELAEYASTLSLTCGGSKYLRNTKEVRRHGLKRFCRIFGLDYAQRSKDAWIARVVFTGLRPIHNLNDRLVEIAVVAYILRDMGSGLVPPESPCSPGNLILSHPLKRFSDEENVLLAMVVNVLRVSKTSTGRVDPLLQQLGYAGDASEKRLILTLAATVQLALAAARLKPVEIHFPEDVPVLFSIVVQKPLRMRKQLHCNALLWECLFGKATMEWAWLGADRRAPVSGAPEPPGLEATTFGAYFTAYVNRQVAPLTAMGETGNSFGEEAIHDARVALRGLLSVCESLKPYLQKGWLRETVPELRRARKVFGAVRDADVIVEHIRVYTLQQPTSQGQPDHLHLFAAQIDRERAAALVAASGYCASEQYGVLLEKLSEDLTEKACLPAVDARFRAIPFQLEGIMAATINQIAYALPIYDTWIHGLFVPEALLHTMRISFKQLRYLIVFFQDIAEKDGEQLIKICKKFQEILGEMHDHAAAGGLASHYLQSLPAHSEEKPVADNLSLYTRYCEEGVHHCAMEFIKLWPAGMKELPLLLRKLSS